MMRTLTVLAALVLAWPASAEPLALTFTAVPLNADQPEAQRLGKLQFRGALHLVGAHKSFGGYSGMAVSVDGTSLRAISDTGSWLNLHLLYDGAARLIGADQAALGPLLDPQGRKLQFSDEVDAESMTVLADGSVLVGFERRHRIWRYPAGSENAGGGLAGRPSVVPSPGDLHLAPFNEGLEALTLLPDGRVLAIAEDMRRRPGATAAWIGVLQGEAWQWQALDYRLAGAWRVTDAAALPNGDVLVLERSFSPFEGFRTRLMHIDAAALQPGTIVEPRELARFEPPWITDNFEAIAVRRGADGRILVWIMSDDNFNRRQRSLLLHFVLED